jgi:hypothetical protein
MTEEQWRRIADRIESTWPGEPDAAEAYRSDLDPLDPDAVERALDDLLIDHRNEAPPPRVVRDRAREIASAGGPSQASDYDAAANAPPPTLGDGPATTPPPGTPPRESRRATVALILGVGGLVTIPIILSVAAIVVANGALAEIARTPGLGGEKRARVGRVLGWIGIGIMVVTVIVGLVLGLRD